MRGLLLRLLLRAADAAAQLLAGEEHGGRELLLMIGPAFADPVLRHRARLGGGQLLQDRLVVALALTTDVGDHPGPKHPLDQLARRGEASIEVHRPQHGLERVGQDAALVATSAHLLAAAEQHEPPEPEVPRRVGEGAHVDDRRTQLRELALGHLGELAEGHVGDDDPQDRVAEELEALVVRGQLVLERVRAVGEREPPQRRVAEADAEDVVEGFRPLQGALSGHALLDLDRLATRVVPAVPADPMGELRLVALGALGVGGGLRLPTGLALGSARMALASLRYRHVDPLYRVVAIGSSSGRRRRTVPRPAAPPGAAAARRGRPTEGR
jgi:hypothetical protein